MANEKRLIDAFESICKKCDHYLVCKYVDDETAECSQYKAYTVDAVVVVHGRWKYYHKKNIAVCTNCSFERDLDANFGKAVSCPNCGADMRERREGE